MRAQFDAVKFDTITLITLGMFVKVNESATWLGSIAPAGALPSSVLALIEMFVKVLDPNEQPPPAMIAEIEVGTPSQKIVAKLSDDRTVVPKARSNVRLKIVSILITDISPKLSRTVQADGGKICGT